MAELKLRSKDPDSLKQIIQSTLSERLQSIEEGIKKTEKQLLKFETTYQMSTKEFITRFHKDELSHSFDFDEWVGESRMLAHLQEVKKSVEEVYFVD